MSSGLCICTECKKEVHQDLNMQWIHCDDASVLCSGAKPEYPKTRSEIQGIPCGRDIDPQDVEALKRFGFSV